MLIKEFRVILPMTVEEYQVAQLWTVAEMSKNETGGGEGVEVVKNEPFGPDKDVPVPPTQLLDGRREFQTGQYTLKWYHLQSKVPKLVRYLAPKGSLDILEEAWNAYPYCRTIVTNPGYMKQDFEIKIETYHLPDAGTTENAHQLPPDLLAKREVVTIDIANDPVAAQDYKAEWDPAKFHSTKTDRGPLGPNWPSRTQPVMTCYKLVTCNFKFFGLQARVEQLIQRSERRLFTIFHRQVFCSIDNWFGLTMEDIRRLEEQTKKELEVLRTTRGVVGSNPDVD